MAPGKTPTSTILWFHNFHELLGNYMRSMRGESFFEINYDPRRSVTMTGCESHASVSSTGFFVRS